MPIIYLGGAVGALVGALLKQTDLGKKLDEELEDGFEKLKEIFDYFKD